MKLRHIIVLSVGCLLGQFPNIAKGQWLDISYGGSLAADIVGFWGNGVPLTNSTGVISVGYFSTIPTFSPVASTFDNFVSLGFSTSFLANGSISVSIEDDFGSINTFAPYVAVFSGITDPSNYATATGFLLFRDSGWGNFPTGGATQFDSVAVDLSSNSFGPSEIVIGEILPGGQIYGAGSQGFGYTVVPEPATYAALIGLLALGLVVVRRRRQG